MKSIKEYILIYLIKFIISNNNKLLIMETTNNITEDKIEYIVKRYIKKYILSFLKLYNNTQQQNPGCPPKAEYNWPISILILGGAALEHYFPNVQDLRTGDFDLRFIFSPTKNVGGGQRRSYFKKGDYVNKPNNNDLPPLDPMCPYIIGGQEGKDWEDYFRIYKRYGFRNNIKWYRKYY